MKYLLRTIVLGLYSLILPALSAVPETAAPGAVALEDWSLEEVLLKFTEANGGEEAIETVNNIRILGEINTDDVVFNFVLLKKRPDKLRMHLEYYPGTIVNGYDGQTAWQQYAEGEQYRVRQLEGKARASLLREASFDGYLIGLPPANSTRRLTGVERIGRVDYFVVEVKASDWTNRYYLDSRTFREFKRVNLSETRLGEVEETVTFYHDYQRHHKIWLAHRMERRLPNGKTEAIYVQQVDINTGILDRIFTMPSTVNPVEMN